LPTKKLSSEDLPTLERPAKANSGKVGSGQPRYSAALITNVAVAVFMRGDHTAWWAKIPDKNSALIRARAR
jgi:hypothetical protein